MDRTTLATTYISYYDWGAAIGLGLDLTLRDRSNGTITLDHYMRALWQTHGKPGGKAPGYVDRPYTMADLRAMLASVSGDARFADDFFDRFIQGRDLVDYERLLDRAGLVLRPASPGQAFAGQFRVQDLQGRPRVVSAVPPGSPAYEAGLERDDEIVGVAGRAIQTAADFDRAIRECKPGDAVPIVFERRGQRITGTLGLVADPRVEIVTAEQAGRQLTAEQRRFRDGWLSSAARNTF
jgi:predicted metalloprotease with PDZ domain